jgi:hypothetical protein
MKRPNSIAEVVAWSTDSVAFWYHVMDFIDELRRIRDPQMLVQEPVLLAQRWQDGAVADAYLAAVAVSLARELGVRPPHWTSHPSRVLRSPWFAHPGPALRATLLAESPAPFRERNLFVSSNALSRA